MSTHTPGPWEVREDDWGVHVHAPTAAGRGCEYTISENVNGDSRTNPKMATPMQNARLIAAAPDLLAALIAVREQIRDDAETGAARFYGDESLIDAAIAKATQP